MLLTFVVPRASLYRGSLNRRYTVQGQTFTREKKTTFHNGANGFPAKWLPRNERRNSVLMTRHYSDLGSASHWSCGVEKFVSANQKRYPNLGGDTSLVWNFCASLSNVICGETTSGVVKCRLFSQAIYFKHCLPVQFYVWYHRDEFILLSKNTDASVNEIPDSGKKQGLSTSKAGTWCTSNNAKFGLKKRSN